MISGHLLGIRGRVGPQGTIKTEDFAVVSKIMMALKKETQIFDWHQRGGEKSRLLESMGLELWTIVVEGGNAEAGWKAATGSEEQSRQEGWRKGRLYFDPRTKNASATMKRVTKNTTINPSGVTQKISFGVIPKAGEKICQLFVLV